MMPRLRAAEIEAERVVALLRMVVAVVLGSFLIFALGPNLPENRIPILHRQWGFAVVTVVAYFLLGLGTWVLVRRDLFRHWMVWPTVIADALFLVLSVWLSMRNTGMAGDAAFAFPSIWLVPLVLAFGVLRINPAVMAYLVALLAAGIALLISLGAGGMRGPGTGPSGCFCRYRPMSCGWG